MKTTTVANPFATTKPAHSGVIFGPDDYLLSLLVNLQPNATRVLLIMVANMDQQTGLVHCTPSLVKKYLPAKGTTSIRNAIAELQRYKMIARSKGVAKFWVNPRVFARFTFEVR